MPKITSSFFGKAITKTDEEVEKEDIVPQDDDNTPNTEDQDREDLANRIPIADEDDSDDRKDDSTEPGSNDSKSNDEDEDDVEFFTTLINEGKEKGLFHYDEDKEYEGTGEEIFWEVQEDTLKKRYQEEYVDTIPEEYRSIFKHLAAGKPLSEWVEAVAPLDYDSINLEDEDNQKQLIEDHLTLTGMDEEDIKDTIKEYEESGTLEKNSKKSLKYLKAHESKKAEVYEKELEEYNKVEKKRVEQELKEFKSEVLATEELGKLKISKDEREKLFDHITKPVNKKGETQLTINQKDRDRQLLFAYLDMKGFDFSKLESQIETKTTSGLRAKLSGYTDTNAKRKGGATVVDARSSIKIPKGSWDAPRDED